MVGIILQLIFIATSAQAKAPVLVFQQENGEFLHQITVMEVNSDTVKVISNSNFMIPDRDLARVGTWTVQGPRASEFIKALRAVGIDKIPITIDRRSHALRVWIDGKKVILTDLEMRVVPTMVEDLLLEKKAELEQGWEFDIKNKKVLRSKLTDSTTPECDDNARLCKFGMNARIAL